MRPPAGGVAVDLGAIRDVWAYNLKEEMEKMRDIGEDYPYVAVDTEFPGCVAKPSGTFRSAKDYNYQTVKCNVDLLKVIQIGLTFCDSSGNTPPGVSTWQFNFAFDLVQDLYAQESIEFLRGCGINFDRHVHEGIAVEDFAEQLTTSGIVLNEEVRRFKKRLRRTPRPRPNQMLVERVVPPETRVLRNLSIMFSALLLVLSTFCLSSSRKEYHRKSRNTQFPWCAR